jgi:hypothetical protein
MTRRPPWTKADELGAENVAPRCEGRTKAGDRCRNSVHSEGTLCEVHRRIAEAPAPKEDGLHRLPGAEVDYGFIDAFEFTPELLADYARRARELLHDVDPNDVPSLPGGRCDDCGKDVAVRWPFGPHRLALCHRDFTSRRRVRRDFTELKAIAGEARSSGSADASPAEGGNE